MRARSPARLRLVCIALVAGAQAARAAGPTVSCPRGDAGTPPCTIRGLFSTLRDATLILADGPGDAPMELRASIRRPDGTEIALPRFYGNERWSWCEVARDDAGRPRLDRVSAGDFDHDGKEDLALVGECVSGAGPGGTEPFLVGAIYFGTGGGRFRTVSARSAALTALLSGPGRGRELHDLARKAATSEAR